MKIDIDMDTPAIPSFSSGEKLKVALESRGDLDAVMGPAPTVLQGSPCEQLSPKRVNVVKIPITMYWF